MNLLSRRTTRWIAGTFVVLCVVASIPQWSGGQQPFGGQFAKQTKTFNPIEGPLPKEWAQTFKWRDIGPANMGGRITAIAVYEPDPSIYYVATGGGGLIKTTNNGITLKHCFDKESTVAIGDVAVSQTDPNVVWVGTGENNPRNSVSYGDGVYKSTDGGETWKNMGLKQSFQIGKILIHPTNPDIVYVGALGRLYGPNSERGVFKTTDGGKSWNKVFYIDDKTGVIDMRMHPKEPDTIIVAMWERMRDGFDSYLGPGRPEHVNVYDPIVKWGQHAGLYKTTDGFKTAAKKLTKGLPSSKMGRIGLDWYLKDPNIVYAIIDCEKIGMGTPPKQVASNAYIGILGEDADNGGAKLTRVVDDGPAGKAGLKVDDIVLKIGDKTVKGYEELIEEVGNRKVGDKVKLQVQRGTGMNVFEVTLADRTTLQGFQGKGGGAFSPNAGPKDRPYFAYYGGQKENVQNRQGPNSHEYGGIYMSKDAGESWTRINSLNSRPMYFSVVRVDPSDNNHLVAAGVSMHQSSDGGKTFRSNSKGVHADHHAWWINPKNGKHQIIGSDGGFYVTYDRGRSWDHYNHLALGQFYHVAASTKQPYWVYGGLQDNGTWGGPSNTRRAYGAINEDWVSVGGGDGFMCRVDPNDPDLVYGTSQDGNIYRRNFRTGERASIRPIPPGAGKGKKGGKGTQEKQPMEVAKDPKGPEPYRFNWNTPFILSNFNSKIFYSAGNYVFKSLDRGNDLRVISPEITLTKRGSATALTESPKNQDILWVGTDDGAIWVTKNGGKDWQNVTQKVGLKGPRWVATIEASRFEEGRAYVAFDAHRSDDDEPYLYVTEDFGQTWKSIRGNLPVGSTRCLREDVENPNLLYCGTEFAFWVSLNRGKDWTKLNNNLPTVAIHEVAVHPTAGEIVAATHGRSLWILDVTALRQITADTMKDLPALYKPHTAIRWQNEPSRGGTNRRYVGKNPDDGANIYYSLAKKADKVSVQVMDVEGAVLARLNGSSEPGLHKVNWNLTRTPAGGQGPQGFGGGGRFGGKGKGGFQGKAEEKKVEAKAGEQKGTDPKTAQGKGGFQGKGGQGQGGGFAGGFRTSVPPGTYKVVLTVDGQQYTSTVRVEADPNMPNAIGITQQEEEKEVVID